jgi:undecaprenyl pyrophosphate synthase
MLLNVGVGYGGREEIVDAVKGYLHERFEGQPLLSKLAGIEGWE